MLMHAVIVKWCLQAPMQRPSGCRALLPTGAGPLLTGSSDGAVRLWDASRPEASYMVCGPPQTPASDAPEANTGVGSGPAQAGLHMPAQAMVPASYVYTHKTIQGVEVVEESCIPGIADPSVSLSRSHCENMLLCMQATSCRKCVCILASVYADCKPQEFAWRRALVTMLPADALLPAKSCHSAESVDISCRNGGTCMVGWTELPRCATRTASPT